MKITISFEALTPAQFNTILTQIQEKVRYEFNPGEWKRPCIMQFGTFTKVDIESPMDIYVVRMEIAK